MTKLLLACPLLLLPACELKVTDPGDDPTLTDATTDATSSATDPDTAPATTTAPNPSDPSATDTSESDTATDGDDPDNDGCVPQQDGPDAALARPQAVFDSSTTSGEDSGDNLRPGTETDFDNTTGAPDTDTDTQGDTDTDTSGDTDTDTDGECNDVLPAETPSPADTNCACDVQSEHRACKTPGGEDGTRFCDQGAWGPCVVQPECVPGTYSVCFFCDTTFGTWVAWCELVNGLPVAPAEDACDTPLVLSFDGRAVEYGEARGEFAMSAGDECGARDWPTAATPWLAIDLDRSGGIDGGHELFGNGSPVAAGAAPHRNGFLALAAFDSDGDRQVTPADARWSELVLWFDDDADRRSTGWELQPLSAHGIVAIDLQYATPASRCDARGNCEVERASFTFEGPDGARSSGEVIDVRLSCQ